MEAPAARGRRRERHPDKTNERPGTRAQHKYARMSASKARIVLDLIRGKTIGEADEILASPSARRRGHPQGARFGDRQRRAQRRDPRRRALRVGLLRRRGSHAQALAPPGPRSRHPDPQAHLSHHRHREPPAGRRAGSHACSRRGGPRGSQRSARGSCQRCRQGCGRGAPSPGGQEPPGQGRGAAAHDHDHDHEHDEVDDVEVDERPARGEPRRQPRRAPTRRPRPASTAPTTTTTTTTPPRPRRRTSNGPEGQPLRLPPRCHHRLEVPLVRQPRRVRRLPHRGLEDPRLPDDPAAARGHQPHRDRAHP
jgi:hypothetical protein